MDRITGLLATQRRKAVAIVLAVVGLFSVAVFLVWAGKSLTASRVDRWLPARPGSAVILNKASADSGPALVVRVEVPEASPAEAALLPSELDGRAAMLPARSFEATVPVTVEQWETIEPGARVRAIYQINVRRSEIFVSALYLDTLSPEPQTP